MKKRRNILGVSWRKLPDSPSTPSKKPVRGKDSASTVNAESVGMSSNMARVMTRMMTFRDSLGTLKQKIRIPSRTQHKRLTNSTPSPFGSARKYSTPGSSARKLSQRARRDVKMYSPFEIITPLRTPASGIKMGTQSSKRFMFSSPGNGDLDKEMTTIVDGIQTLAHGASSNSPACTFDGRTRRSGIRTTPRGGRSESKKPLFV